MTDDRRRFFRIDDTVGVAYRLLSDEELNSQDDGIDNPTTVFTLLANYEITITDLLKKVGDKDPVLEAVLATLNKKVNCVINQMELDSNLMEKLAYQVQEVNISACGVAFRIEEEIQIGQTLGLDFALRPDNVHVFTYGTVVQREAIENQTGYFIRINFHGMQTSDQETLIQHIVKRQSSSLRTVRETKKP